MKYLFIVILFTIAYLPGPAHSIENDREVKRAPKFAIEKRLVLGELNTAHDKWIKGFTHLTTGCMLLKDTTNNNTKMLLSLYRTLSQKLKLDGTIYKKNWEATAKGIMKYGYQSSNEPILKRQTEIYKSMLLASKDSIANVITNENNKNFKDALVELCNAEVDVVSKMFLFVKYEQQHNINKNQDDLAYSFKKRDRVSEELKTQYKIFVGEIPQPTITKSTQSDRKPTVSEKKLDEIFGKPETENEIIRRVVDFESVDFKTAANNTLLNKKAAIDFSPLSYPIKNFATAGSVKTNFKYLEYGGRFSFENNSESFAAEDIGKSLPPVAKLGILYANSTNRALTLLVQESWKESKKLFYGISLMASSKNNQQMDEAGNIKNQADYVSYALLINDAQFKIIKYKGTNEREWENKGNAETITKAKLPELSTKDNVSFSIRKNGPVWDFFLNDNFIYTLRDTEFMHCINETGKFVSTGKSIFQIKHYKLVGTKN